MNQTFRSVIVAAAFTLNFCSLAAAWKSGAPAAKNGSIASGGVTCRDCHAGEDGIGGVEILGAPASYAPDMLYKIGVKVSDPEQLGGGFEISVEDSKGSHVGDLIRSDTLRTTVAAGPAGWLTHSLFGVLEGISQWEANGESVQYNVEWRAPSEDVGPITFYAAGNAINDSGQPDGDHIYTTTVTSLPPSVKTCSGDVNQDAVVDPQDAGYVLARLGCSVEEGDPDCTIADANEDGTVDPLDAGFVLSRIGECP